MENYLQTRVHQRVKPAAAGVVTLAMLLRLIIIIIIIIISVYG